MKFGLRKWTAFVLLLVAVALNAGACSNRAVYDNLRVHQRQECGDQPMSSYEQCLERTRQTYEAYKRERREALEL
ncbi:hypothetical protein [Pseudohongiella sp.]|uniref:Uncharacterized protein n=1 Tax=marine sediment metagenome TaxID=412755 RepID=A0A0F9W3F3_9ZZZZ|nr:hypothetical protein [Pseudohongiella sp.]HDZ08320.1 hypothetical protein [Pseudohongiella sp.]HEA62596.1 hypothetical protein [Pseudohongiella sp.]